MDVMRDDFVDHAGSDAMVSSSKIDDAEEKEALPASLHPAHSDTGALSSATAGGLRCVCARLLPPQPRW